MRPRNTQTAYTNTASVYALIWLISLMVNLASGWAAPRIDAVPLVSGLARITEIAHAGDGTGRVFVVFKAGQIHILANGQLQPQPILDISAKVSQGSEQGLLGLAFHPQFGSNGWLYLNYTDSGGATVVARYQWDKGAATIDSGSEVKLLTIEQPFINHNAGKIAFGPDGYLYIATGDGGDGGDPLNSGQQLNTLLGKILRIDVDGPFPYGIPPDNPFIKNPQARPEIWSYGLRNPWKFSFDRQSGDLFIADVGQNKWEEVNWAPAASNAGRNYGWRRMEGKDCFNPSSDCNDGGLTLPITVYDHDQGCSVTGGYLHRGGNDPALNNLYWYGDFCSGTIWSTHRVADEWQTTAQFQTPHRISTFGETEAGELLFAHFSSSAGAIYGIYDDQVGSQPGLIVKRVRLANPLTLMLNITNNKAIAADAIEAEWILLAATLNGQDTGLYFLTPSAVVAAVDVNDLDDVAFPLKTSNQPTHLLAALAMADLNLTPGDTLAYAYAFKTAGEPSIVIDNIVRIMVMP